MFSNLENVGWLSGSIMAWVFIIFFKNLLRSYLNPRERSAPEKYPFETTVFALRNQHRVLESLYDMFFIDNKEIMGGNQSCILNVFGFVPMLMTNSVANITHILRDNYQNYGKTGSLKVKFQPLLGDGIFNADGDQWYGHRKTSAHLFKLEKFRTSIMGTFNEEMNSVLTLIDGYGGQPFDMQNLMAKLTLESIGRVALGIELGCLKKENTVVPFEKMFDYCTAEIDDSLTNPFWRLRRYFTPSGWKFYWYISQLDQFCYKIIRDRRTLQQQVTTDTTATTTETVGAAAEADSKDKDKDKDKNTYSKKSDLLSLYLDKDNFTSLSSEKSSSSTSGRKAYVEPTDKNLRDVVLNITIAGRDTTANALSWSVFRLCVHPEIQQKIRKEIFQVLPVADEAASPRAREESFPYEAIQKMRYLEAFCMEVLRLHPSVPKEGKIAQQDDTLPDGTKVLKGDMVVFLPWIMGRDTTLWGEDALEFEPQRFLDNPKPSSYVFTAFQAGPRVCLGQNFAMLEMKTCLARMLAVYEFELVGDEEDVGYANTLTHPINRSLMVTAREIAHSPSAPATPTASGGGDTAAAEEGFVSDSTGRNAIVTPELSEK